jgi:N-acetylglutamate synthase-like GNAT family acetyltransferase
MKALKAGCRSSNQGISERTTSRTHDEDRIAKNMARIHLVEHAPGAPGLRLFGLGPNLRPTRGLLKLRRLLDKHAFWAQGRSRQQLREMLKGSQVIVSLWRGKRMVGFGRANSDGIYRAVLWDVVVAGDLQGRGLGRRVVEALLASPKLREVERVYLMTTNSNGFYEQMGFSIVSSQHLLIRKQ